MLLVLLPSLRDAGQRHRPTEETEVGPGRWVRHDGPTCEFRGGRGTSPFFQRADVRVARLRTNSHRHNTFTTRPFHGDRKAFHHRYFTIPRNPFPAPDDTRAHKTGPGAES
eukprot:GHVR01039109.1.p2 GENE.GHVR01039109.1~~GHVR01039109.1.p2  ORF type:complete len:111 (+),score=4.46 GHVR01039109.1:38-370(+)